MDNQNRKTERKTKLRWSFSRETEANTVGWEKSAQELRVIFSTKLYKQKKT